jgi:LmbE family N-acetylglucosaminyl deacetylase
MLFAAGLAGISLVRPIGGGAEAAHARPVEVSAVTTPPNPRHGEWVRPKRKGSARNVLNIVAHHDDDLLFLSPHLIDDIQSGATVRTVFLVASDYTSRYNVPYPKYMKDREAGIRAAYAAAAGIDPAAWRSQPYVAERTQATQWTLGANISIIELRAPDDSTNGAHAMWHLYASNTALTTRPGDLNPPQTLDRDGMINFLRHVATEFQPDVIHTLDPSADLHNVTFTDAWDFHLDHLAAARLTMLAYEGWSYAPITYYRDYTINVEDPALRLTPADTTRKSRIFDVYTAFDQDARVSRTYHNWCGKGGQADSRWLSDLVIPLPAGAGGPRGPHIGTTYYLVNRATRLEVAVSDSSGPGAAGLVSAASADDDAHRFELRATPRGFALTMDGTRGAKAVDMPGMGLTPGAQAAVTPANGARSQVLQIRGNPTGGYLITFGHSGLALAAQGGVGTPVIQEAVNDHPNQRWDLLPSSGPSRP